MTEEDSFNLASDDSRIALGDLTNRLNKRAISGDSSFYKSEEDENDSRVKFSKRLCVVVDDLVKESASSKGSSDCDSRDGNVPSKELYFEPGDKDGARDLSANQTDVSSGHDLALSVLRSDTSSKSRTLLPNCSSLRSFELSKCSNVNKKKDKTNTEDDLLKSCSCSFCLKAAYIWSDLHYQDIKGRLSALKKSQKEASNLIQRNDKEKSTTDFHSSVDYAKMESNLKGQWRSLFVSMGDILADESNHLQNSYLKMRELREDCKIDLERATKTTQHNT